MSPGVEESAMTKGEREWRKYVKATSDRYVMTEGERRWLEYRRELPCKRGAADVMPSPFANVDLLCKICSYMKDDEAVWCLSSCKELRGASTEEGVPLIKIHEERGKEKVRDRLAFHMRGVWKAANRRNDCGFVVGERVVIEYDDLNSTRNFWRGWRLRRYKPTDRVGKFGYVMGTTPQFVYVAMGDLFKADNKVKWVKKPNHCVRRARNAHCV